MNRKGRWAVAALSLFAACGGGSGGGPHLAAAWQFVSGPAFSASQLPEEDFSSVPKFLVLEDGGVATLVLREETSQALFCYHGIYTTTPESLFVQIQRPFDAPTFVFLQRQPDVSTLELTDSGGGITRLARQSSLPAAFQCGSFHVRSSFGGLAVSPQFFGGLAWDGTSLWFTADQDEKIYPLDPATGVLGTPLTFGFTQFRLVHAVQNGDFWTVCGCGHGQEAQRLTTGAVLVDSVDTLADLGDEISIGALAYDDVGGFLWLQGSDFVDTVGRFMKVNSDAEPDLLIKSSDFDLRLRGMTWDGTHLWAVTIAQTIVEIDVSTMKVVATFESPDADVEWAGIASAPSVAQPGNSLYLIGTNRATGLGTLLELEP